MKKFKLPAFFKIASLCVVINLVSSQTPTTAPLQKCREEYELGTPIVHAVIAELESLGILQLFPPDHNFLRRLAHVETRDGYHYTLSAELLEADKLLLVAGGGIWAIDREKLKSLQRAINEETEALINIQIKIDEILGLNNFTGQSFEDIIIEPLHCAVIARFIIYHQELTNNSIKIPLARNIMEQAEFWVNYYCNNESRNCRVEHFVEEVADLEEREGNST